MSLNPYKTCKRLNLQVFFITAQFNILEKWPKFLLQSCDWPVLATNGDGNWKQEESQVNCFLEAMFSR